MTMACDFFLLKDELMTQFVKQILEIFINSFSDKDVAALFIENFVSQWLKFRDLQNKKSQ